MRVLALDLSTTQTGWALGENGIVSSYGCFKRPKDLKEDTDIFLWYAKQITDKAVEGDIQVCFCEDWVYSRFPAQMLRSACLRGAVTVMLKHRMVVDTLFTPPSQWRKACGIDLKGLPRKGRRAILKQMAIDKCISEGYDVKNDDEAEAIQILVASKVLLETE